MRKLLKKKKLQQKSMIKVNVYYITKVDVTLI